jgi:hypothetical protein
VSKQCGAAVLLRRFAERRLTAFDAAPAEHSAPLVTFSETLPADRGTADQVRQLQQFLNSFPGIFLRVDGVPGPKTSDAHRQVTGHFLSGDPRAMS